MGVSPMRLVKAPSGPSYLGAEGFRKAIADAGLTPPLEVVADGRLHRFASNGEPGDGAGWYVSFPTGAGGVFGCWRQGLRRLWFGQDRRTMPRAERRELSIQISAVNKERGEACKAARAECRKHASDIWRRSQQADINHPYLKAKEVRPHNILQEGGDLLIPLRDIKGIPQSFQRIGPDGQKRFLYGTEVRGHFFLIGEIRDFFIIAEGYATAASIHEATGIGVVVAFSAGNLASVATALRRQHSAVQIVIAGDNDDNGVGQKAALQAAELVGGRAIFPTSRGDWNDVVRVGGTGDLKSALADSTTPGESGPRGGTRSGRGTPAPAADSTASNREGCQRRPSRSSEGAITASAGKNLVADIFDPAEEVENDPVPESKPRLLVEHHNPDLTVAALRDILAKAGGLYDRGVPVRLATDQMQRGAVAQVITPDGLVRTAHGLCRPYVIKTKRDGTVSDVDARLPRPLAVMYLDWRGEWRLPPLNGIASAPLLTEDGSIHSTAGYDLNSGMWCEDVPDLTGLVPEHPTQAQAAAALRLIRETFKTFCFADAETIEDVVRGVAVVDTGKAPGRDESAFLVAALTAACRPSLYLAPGVILRAPPMSGAGAGKGLLARCIAAIAFGREPHAVTAGATAEELEKRIAAELIEGSPVLFLDNLNNTALRSELLASAITERPARIRLLGKSLMVPLNATAFVILTGNGLSVSEDLARRFITVDFDPRTEDPEARPFTGDILAEVKGRRAELLAAMLTIWRRGRQAAGITPGRPLGSFDQWSRWVRDPLLTLGCKDPAERVGEAKERDGRRQAVAGLFAIWWHKHQDRPVAISGLDEAVRQVADPQERGRQFLAASIEKLSGTRIAGFVLTRQAAPGKWGVATYALKRTDNEEGHRDHGGHRDEAIVAGAADPPDAPYADGQGGVEGEVAGAVGRPMPPMPPMPSPDSASTESGVTPPWRARL